MDIPQHHFITNQDQLLAEVMESIFPMTQNLYFLVGFFYFSGFEEIYKHLDDKNVKMLVGLDIEKGIINKVKEVEVITEDNISRGKIRYNFNESFIQLFNESDFFDSPKKQEAFKIFVNKIKDGSLEIRKTKTPNHSKLYLFERKKEFSELGTYPGTVITGSSNLTASGLRHQFELNVILRKQADYIEGKRVFDSLWSSAVVIADKDHVEEFELEVLEKIWFEKLFKPYYIFIRVLHEYFSVEYNKSIKLPNEITKNRFLDLKYQTDAIRQALHIIETHNGVIIADVVGLGKSIIASTVAHNLSLKAIVIAPPHLVKQWDDEYRDFFDFNAKVFSSGSIDKALNYFNENYDGEERLIIVDEAHKYRNEEKIDYGNLHRLCQGNKVILLTATPFNNRPQDIFSMVKLFQIPAKSTLKTVNNLGEEFTRLVRQYKQLSVAQKDKTKTKEEIKNELEDIANQIRNIISPLVIRRSRIDLKEIEEYRKDIEIQGIEFPIVNPPQILEYELGDIETLYIDTLEKISSEDGNNCFKGTRYKPVTYLKDFKKYRKKIEDAFGDFNLFRESQTQVSQFMRHLLVKRFESSVYAFKCTLEYMITSSKNILNWLEVRGKVPIYKKGRLPEIMDFLETSSDDLTEELNELNFDEVLEKLQSKGLFEIDVEDIKVDFKKDLIKDIELLEAIHKRWFENGIQSDPKLSSFGIILKNQLKKEPNRKIIVFSEFSDTIDYLYEQLKNQIRVFKYTSKDATSRNKETIRKNFDAGIQNAQKVNDYEVLFATDAISEGYNLHRAGTIFNFDIPYNPTRVIQRVGRINRINKKVFNELFIYNYFPTETGESETRTKEISTLKIAMIHALLGEDTKILTNDEELRSYFKEEYERNISKVEERSWENPFLNLYNSLKSANTEVFKQAIKIPVRTRIQRTVKKDRKGVIVFGRKGNDCIFKLGISANEDIPLTADSALSIFEAKITEEPAKVSDGFEPIYEYVKRNIFKKKALAQSDKLKREIIDKLDLVVKDEVFKNKDYLRDLKTQIELDSLPRHFMKYINKLPIKEFHKLTEEIPHRYIITVLNRAEEVDAGEETLILSEELQNL
ncbi:MAG: helicase [Bacteroidales bacterium]|nr:helicase [Bacteroidales bacterium]